jgi:hypothetical protein
VIHKEVKPKTVNLQTLRKLGKGKEENKNHRGWGEKVEQYIVKNMKTLGSLCFKITRKQHHKCKINKTGYKSETPSKGMKGMGDKQEPNSSECGTKTRLVRINVTFPTANMR